MGGKQENSQIILAVLDNGPGATEQQLHALYSEDEVSGGKSGLGFYLIRDLAKAISCKISVKTNASTGMEFQLILKTV
jgi:K+-sensing histidine kinase KdpD